MHRPVRLKVLMARLNDIPAADRARTVQLEMGEMNRCRRDGTRRGAMGLQFAPSEADCDGYHADRSCGDQEAKEDKTALQMQIDALPLQ